MSMLIAFHRAYMSRFRPATRSIATPGVGGSNGGDAGSRPAVASHFVSAKDDALHVAGEGSGLVQQAFVPVTEHDELPRSVGATGGLFGLGFPGRNPSSGAGRPSNGPSGSASSGLGCLGHA